MEPQPPTDNQSTTVKPQPPKPSNAKEIVLQWLSYSFWFWLLFVEGVILGSSLAYFIADKGGDYTWVVYMLAPLIVLLPAAVITDHFYKKIETVNKRGFSSVVMVVSAVLACLIAVGSLITVVVSAVGLILESGGSSGRIVVVISSLIASVLSLLLFIRIIHIERLDWIRKNFSIMIGVITAITAALTIFGPMSYAFSRKSDRLVENEYNNITREIKDYTSSNNGELPGSLSDVDLKAATQEAVEVGDITYEKVNNEYDDDSLSEPYYRGSNKENKYKLCVTWDHEKVSDYESSGSDSDVFLFHSHKKGKQCYTEYTYSPSTNY